MARGRHQHGDGPAPPVQVPPGASGPPPPPYVPPPPADPPQSPAPPNAPPPPAPGPWGPPPGWGWHPYAPPPWQPPRPASRWQTFWVVTLVVVGGVAAAGMLPLYIWAMSSNHAEMYEAQEFSDPVILDAVAGACEDLRRELALIRPATADASPGRLLRTVRDENAAIDAFVAEVRTAGADRLDADRPGWAYLADWEALATAREEYARSYDTMVARRRFRVPRSDGVPITDRMDDAAPCRVPARLTSLPYEGPQPLVETTR